MPGTPIPAGSRYSTSEATSQFLPFRPGNPVFPRQRILPGTPGKSRGIELSAVPGDLDNSRSQDPEEPEIPVIAGSPDLQVPAGIPGHAAEAGKDCAGLPGHSGDRVVQAPGPDPVDNGGPADLLVDEIENVPVVMPAEDDKAPGTCDGQGNVNPFLRQTHLFAGKVIPSFIAQRRQQIDSGQEIVRDLWMQGICQTELPAITKMECLAGRSMAPSRNCLGRTWRVIRVPPIPLSYRIR
jgi:hypothetical protein